MIPKICEDPCYKYGPDIEPSRLTWQRAAAAQRVLGPVCRQHKEQLWTCGRGLGLGSRVSAWLGVGNSLPTPTFLSALQGMSISRDGIDVSRVGALGAWDGSMGNRQPPQGSLAGTSQRTGLEAGYSQPFSSEHKPGNNITWLPVPYVSGL